MAEGTCPSCGSTNTYVYGHNEKNKNAKVACRNCGNKWEKRGR